MAGVLWRGGMSWDELGEQPPLFSPARGTRRCAAVPGPRAPGRAARCSRVHQGLRCRLLAPSCVPCCRPGALQGVRVLGFVPSTGMPYKVSVSWDLPPASPSRCHHSQPGWRGSGAASAAGGSKISGASLAPSPPFGGSSCMCASGAASPAKIREGAAGGRARGAHSNSSAASSCGAPCLVAHPAGDFSVPCMSPSLLPAWARGVGWARGRVLGFWLLPSGSAHPRWARCCATRRLCLARCPHRPARFIFQSGSRQVPLLIPRGLCGALKRVGVRGEPAWGCWQPPARRPPAVPAVIAVILVCVSRGSGRASRKALPGRAGRGLPATMLQGREASPL